MEEYLVFAMDYHGELGGISDLQGEFDSVDEAEKFLQKLITEKKYDYGYIVDKNTMKIIHKYSCD